jgi:protein-S-isoprenylcysteine O-methyltransferase Ste14
VVQVAAGVWAAWNGAGGGALPGTGGRIPLAAALVLAPIVLGSSTAAIERALYAYAVGPQLVLGSLLVLGLLASVGTPLLTTIAPPAVVTLAVTACLALGALGRRGGARPAPRSSTRPRVRSKRARPARRA